MGTATIVASGGEPSSSAPVRATATNAPLRSAVRRFDSPQTVRNCLATCDRSTDVRSIADVVRVVGEMPAQTAVDVRDLHVFAGARFYHANLVAAQGIVLMGAALPVGRDPSTAAQTWHFVPMMAVPPTTPMSARRHLWKQDARRTRRVTVDRHHRGRVGVDAHVVIPVGPQHGEPDPVSCTEPLVCRKESEHQFGRIARERGDVFGEAARPREAKGLERRRGVRECLRGAYRRPASRRPSPGRCRRPSTRGWQGVGRHLRGERQHVGSRDRAITAHPRYATKSRCATSGRPGWR